MSDIKEIDFYDLFDLEYIQTLQDDFSNATGVASIITDTNGIPLTKPSNFTKLCFDIIRKTDLGYENCCKSDAKMGEGLENGYKLQKCSSGGLWDSGTAIIVDGKHIANWLIGQIRDENQNYRDISEYIKQIGADEEQAALAFNDVPQMSIDKFKKIAVALSSITNQLSKLAYQNILHQRIIEKSNRVETAMVDSERKYRLLFENMTSGFALHEMVYDNGNPVDYRYIDVNPAFEKLTGAKKSDLIGHTVKEIMPHTEQYWIDTYGNVTQTGIPISYENYSQEIGKHFDVWAFSPEPNKFAVVFTDVTAKKNAEEIIAAKNKELEQIIFVASHDLRTPLVNIEGYSRELEYSINEIIGKLELQKNISNNGMILDLKADIRSVKESLAIVRNSTKQMDILIKGLLKLSRTGRESLKISNIDMNLLVSDVISSMEFQVKSISANIIVERLLPCVGDEVHLIQVFSNLISNSIKYLEVKRPLIIEIKSYREGNNVVYTLEDNGIGIGIKNKDKIFELFYRINPKLLDGEGIGLTIVRQILGKLNGKIQVESDFGDGCKFYITLPAG